MGSGTDQPWPCYVRSLLATSVAGVVVLYLLLRLQGHLFFNANSAHPFENPGPLTNVIEITLMLLVPVACIRMFGWLVGDRRQGWALLAVAGVLLTAWMGVPVGGESPGRGTAPAAAHSAMEGKETAFGVPGSAAFG